MSRNLAAEGKLGLSKRKDPLLDNTEAGPKLIESTTSQTHFKHISNRVVFKRPSLPLKTSRRERNTASVA